MRRVASLRLLGLLATVTVGFSLATSACMIGTGGFARTTKARYAAVDALQCPASEIHPIHTYEREIVVQGCGRSVRVYCDISDQCAVVDEDAEKSAAAGASGTSDSTIAVLRTVLPSIPYRDCGVGGDGKLELTIDPDGSVQRAQLVAGAYDDAATECVLQRFSQVQIPAFTGKPRTFRWAVRLPTIAGGGEGSSAEAKVEVNDDGDATTVTLRAVLSSIPYRDCGKGGAGAVSLSVDGAGTTKKVSVDGKGYGAATKKCLEQRFASVHAPAPGGQGAVIRWEISLPDASGSDW